MQEKKCYTCKKTKPVSAFNRSTTLSGGYQGRCKDCCREYFQRPEVKRRQKVYYKEHYQIRTADRYVQINELKSKPCTDCGNTFNPVCMDFDHLRDKKFDIGIAVNKGRISMEEILLEIEKCELVCANCHRIRTHERRKAM